MTTLQINFVQTHIQKADDESLCDFASLLVFTTHLISYNAFHEFYDHRKIPSLVFFHFVAFPVLILHILWFLELLTEWHSIKEMSSHLMSVLIFWEWCRSFEVSMQILLNYSVVVVESFRERLIKIQRMFDGIPQRLCTELFSRLLSQWDFFHKACDIRQYDMIMLCYPCHFQCVEVLS